MFDDTVIDKRISELFYYISRARILGGLLIFASMIMFFNNFVLYREGILKLNVFVVVGLICLTFGILIFTKLSIITCLLPVVYHGFFGIVMIVNSLLTSDGQSIYSFVVQGIFFYLWFDCFMNFKRHKLVSTDVELYHSMRKKIGLKQPDMKMIKAKFYNLLFSRKLKIVFYENIVLVGSRLRNELYIATKENFEIVKESKGMLSQKCTVMIAGRKFKLILGRDSFAELKRELVQERA